MPLQGLLGQVLEEKALCPVDQLPAFVRAQVEALEVPLVLAHEPDHQPPEGT